MEIAYEKEIIIGSEEVLDILKKHFKDKLDTSHKIEIVFYEDETPKMETICVAIGIKSKFIEEGLEI